MDDQQFGGDIFEPSPGLEAWTNGVEPVGGNDFDSLFASGHEGESAERMTIAFRAVARRFSTAPIRNRQRARKSIVGHMEARQQKAGTSAKAGSFRTASRRNDEIHLIVIIQSDINKNNTP